MVIKTEALKARRLKIRALEREISDLHSEFELERADYLESIRKSDASMQFYKQLLDRAIPLLRRENRFWEVEEIRNQSEWNDDTKKWKLPEDCLRRTALPPAIDNNPCEAHTAPGRIQAQSLPQSPNVDEESCDTDRTDFLIRKLQNGDNQVIVDSYFRPKRARELLLRQSNSSSSNKNRNMLNKLITNPDLYAQRTILPTNHTHFAAFTSKLKNI